VPHRPDNDAIYYAYTEVFSENDASYYVAFGSDDYGKAWFVEGKDFQLIMNSGQTPHPWIPDRVIKRIDFKKGYNPILFKVENAWGNMGFSVCIFLGQM
jgi:hypothetical protein